MKDNSFVRVIVTLTTLIAIISMFIRMWLYTYWADYKNSKQYYLKLMELQEYTNNKENKGNEIASPSKVASEAVSLRRIDTAEERAYYEKKDRKLLEK